MKILVINGDCLQVNSSANLCHLAYLRGLIASGHDVTLLSADGGEYSLDRSMEIPAEIQSYTIPCVTFYERLSLMKKKKAEPASTVSQSSVAQTAPAGRSKLASVKKFILSLYGPYGINAKFISKARHFHSQDSYDYLLSISTPPASHMAAYRLLTSGAVKAKHWIQIWEDPWYNDIYGYNHTEQVRKEEARLLARADQVCYVSPLTLKNQQKLFPASADKMYWQPLPYYYKDDANTVKSFSSNRYGYFGDYTPAARNLRPFYDAAKDTGITVNICGSPNTLFPSSEHIVIHPRLPLHELKPIEDDTNVLVFLCNRKGGQIPGKIYQYSATNKIILFILDGTEEEQSVLREYFRPFHRYVFCQNTKEDIMRAISQIESGHFGDVSNTALNDFDPVSIIHRILKMER